MTQIWKAPARSVVVGVLVGTAALVGPVPTAAYAEPGEPFQSTPSGAESIVDVIPAETLRRMAAQTPLIDAANVIRTAVEGASPRGYAGIGLVDDHVTLWWKGVPPADIAAAVATVRRTASVEVARATYSRTELEKAAAKLVPVVEADRADAAHAVRLRTDGAGVEVAVDDTAGAALPKLPATGVRTTIVERDRLAPISRNADSAPYDGGAYISPAPGSWCTAGFGVTNASTAATYLLSAGHCGSLGQVWSTGAGTQIGAVTHRNADHDTMLISTPTPGDHIYVGGVNDEVRARVVGWTKVFPGQLLCQSGVTSAGVLGGPICDLRVEFHYDDREELVEATQVDGEQAARQGDSGGPVYAVNADGTVLAAGTTTRFAGPGFGFQDFATARADFGDLVPATAIPSSCRVSYAVTDSWGTGFTASVTVYNDGPAVSGWSLGWNFPGGQLIQGHWNGVFQQSGSAVTVANENYNAAIPTGGAVSFGFTANGSPTAPAPFTLNGTTCN
ncbi:cellulose-binding domain-containing protein [Plantactinospora sp. S1510]|uniref:Cellulose-binding domain-containing protein n=1 Tax=Plantactinospora alkalitolerans TaxID=2789879 RepID=A0ABS0H3H1_9ACTN|nr:cellulose binding domain-containing protein [Plantactinospora alkalitolerans]MBF9132869.1 cellulose-binding domain-containing protein [Plantactinospora alkalitolerans]